MVLLPQHDPVTRERNMDLRILFPLQIRREVGSARAFNGLDANK